MIRVLALEIGPIDPLVLSGFGVLFDVLQNGNIFTWGHLQL